MRRLTVEEAVDAYKQTGLKPCRHIYTDYDSHACAVGAIAAVAHDGPCSGGIALAWAERVFNRYYLAGFTNGFDDVVPRKKEVWRSKQFILGYQDGLLVAEAVFGAAKRGE